MANKKQKILIAELPDYLHKALKMQAIEKGTSMRAITTKALKNELKIKTR